MSYKAYALIKNFNLQPRYPQKIVEKQIYEPKPEHYPNTRPATQDDWYDAGITARDIVVNGKNCLEKKGEVYWCER
jgi:hypothetical protein